MDLIAQTSTTLPGSLRGIGPLGLEKIPGPFLGLASLALFNKVISGAIGIMTIIASLWFLFLLIGGAYGMMTAGGDKQAMENARKKITNGLTGFIVVIIAVFLLELFGSLIGLDFVLNPAEFVIKYFP